MDVRTSTRKLTNQLPEADETTLYQIEPSLHFSLSNRIARISND